MELKLNAKVNRQLMVKMLIDKLIPDESPIENIYEKARRAQLRYLEEKDFPSKEDKEALIILASGYMANITYMKRHICDVGLGEYSDLWSALMEVFILSQNMFMSQNWNIILMRDKELNEMIDKTSNPDRIRMILKGFNLKQLMSL